MATDQDSPNLPAKLEPEGLELAPRDPTAGALVLPDLLERAGAGGSYADFFLAQFENDHTRRAYKRHVDRFLEWCDGQGVELSGITPRLCGIYRDLTRGAPATKKQMLGALRGFFDLLVERHFCLLNPAKSTRNPREQLEHGKTPEIPAKEVERLIASIDASTLVGKRDRAVIAAWAATGVRIGAVAKLRLKNYFYHDGQFYLELDEKNSKHREVPVRHDLQAFLNDYILAAGLSGAPEDHHLFRTAVGKTGKLREYEPEVYEDGALEKTARGALSADDMRKLLKRRLTDAGFGSKETRVTPNGHRYTHHQSRYSPHSFRVMVVTDLLDQGNDIHDVAYLVGHSSTATTQGYNRSKRKVKRNLVERIRVNLEEEGKTPTE